MKIMYTGCVDAITCGVAGRFERDVPRDVSDEIGTRLLKKRRIKFMEVSGIEERKTKFKEK